MQRKPCISCEVPKPLDEFYRHKGMADGRLNKCKDCCKRDTKTNRVEKRSQYAAYERNRNQTPKRKGQRVRYQENYRTRYPEKYKANQAVANAIRDGIMEKEACEICGTEAEAHHEDYSKPLEVRWLCLYHHRERHKELNE